MYIENKYWEILDKALLVSKNPLPGRNDYKEGGMWYALFSAPNIKYSSTIIKFGIIDEHKTFNGFTNLSDNLDRKENFNKADGGKLIAKVPLNWRKSFSQGVVIPQKKWENLVTAKKRVYVKIVTN